MRFSLVSVLAELWPVVGRCTVIAKRELFYLWPFGLATWLWGTIFIDRLNNEQAQSTINQTGEQVRNKQVNDVTNQELFL
jgi:lysophosphatidate acyltransferase